MLSRKFLTTNKKNRFIPNNIFFITIFFNIILSEIFCSNSVEWNYLQHGNDWSSLKDSLCDPAISNQAPLRLNSKNYQSFGQDKIFFADSFKNIEAQFNLIDQGNNLIINSTLPISTIHTNLYQFTLDQKVYIYNDMNCTKIYMRFPGEHEIDGKRFDVEMQFDCSAKMTKIIDGKKINAEFNLHVAYPFNISPDDKQIKFFDDIFKNEDLKLNNTFIIESVDEFMNNFNMFYRIFYYYGKNNF